MAGRHYMMPKKRRRAGRSKGRSKGRVGYVECSMCHARIPRDKAIKVTVWRSLVDPALARELEKQGAFLMRQKLTKYYCVSCAIFHKIVKIRAKEERKIKGRIRAK